MEGIPLRLVDTAGLRQTSCDVEAMGIERARKYIEMADIQIYVVDGSKPITADVAAWMDGLTFGKAIVLLNKQDLGLVTRDADFVDLTVVRSSLTHGEGLDDVRSAILAKLN